MSFIVNNYPEEMNWYARELAENPNTLLRTLNITHLQADKTFQLTPVDLGAASYEALTSVQVVALDDPGNVRKGKVEDALVTVARWGWSNSLEPVSEVKVVASLPTTGFFRTDGDSVVMKWLATNYGAVAVAPWFEIPSRLHWIGPAELVGVLLRMLFSRPTARRRILLKPEWVDENDEKSIAAMLIHEALHHELYPVFGNCLACTDDHRGIGVAWKLNAVNIGTVDDEEWPFNEGARQPGGVYGSAESENDLTEVLDFSPKFNGSTPPQNRLDLFQQILADWGISHWVQWACPENSLHYIEGAEPPGLIDRDHILYSNQSEWDWAIKVSRFSLFQTVEKWVVTSELTDSAHARAVGALRGRVAIMSRIGKLEETFPAGNRR